MSNIKVTTPNTDYNGEVGGVTFVRGEGEVDSSNHSALSYFDRRGYQVHRKGTKTESAPVTHPASGVQVQGQGAVTVVGNQEPGPKLDGANTPQESNATSTEGNPPTTPSSEAGASGKTAEEQNPPAEEDPRSKDDLKEELRKLDLPVSGSKPELLQRLADHNG